jgi:hypothetical protein
MGISLNGLTPAGTYPGLIKTGDNTAISGTPKVLSDGNGNNLPMEVSTTGVNLTGSPTVNSVAIANTTQVAAKQDTLVSGTNIKTINGTSVLGSGNIAVVTSPSGVSGAIQFSNGSAFASDASNFFWDDTNKRFGVGTNTPFEMMQIGSPTNRGTLNIVNDALSPFIRMAAGNSGNNQSTIIGDGNGALDFKFNGTTTLYLDYQNNVSINTARLALGAKLGVRGSGSTSATTSLLVQNSVGTSALQIKDDLSATFSGTLNIRRDATNFTMRLGNLGQDNCFIDASTNNQFYLVDATFSNNFTLNNVGTSFGGSPTASAKVSVNSTTQGFLPPRMTTTQKNAIASPAAGLVVYDSTTNKLQCYNGSTWNDLF